MMLLELVKASKKEDEQALQEIINLFEPKIRRSLSLTHYHQREDLEQELKYKLITCVRGYDVDSTPGFWEMQERLKK